MPRVDILDSAKSKDNDTYIQVIQSSVRSTPVSRDPFSKLSLNTHAHLQTNTRRKIVQNGLRKYDSSDDVRCDGRAERGTENGDVVEERSEVSYDALINNPGATINGDHFMPVTTPCSVPERRQDSQILTVCGREIKESSVSPCSCSVCSHKYHQSVSTCLNNTALSLHDSAVLSSHTKESSDKTVSEDEHFLSEKCKYILEINPHHSLDHQLGSSGINKPTALAKVSNSFDQDSIRISLASREKTSRCLSTSPQNSLQQNSLDISGRHNSKRTATAQQSAQTRNSSGQKFSDFSISFLLNQDKPSPSRKMGGHHNGEKLATSTNGGDHINIMATCTRDHGNTLALCTKEGDHVDRLVASTTTEDQNGNQPAITTTEYHHSNSITPRKYGANCANERTTLLPSSAQQHSEHCDQVQDGSPVQSVSRHAALNTPETNRKRSFTDGDHMQRGQDAQTMSKMVRFKYRQHQINFLKAEFAKNRYPTYEGLVGMSQEIDVPIRQLQIWFQNKRASVTGTRRPKNRRIDDSQISETISKSPPYLPHMQARPQQMCPVVPATYTPRCMPHFEDNIHVRDFQSRSNGSQAFSPRGLHVPSGHQRDSRLPGPTNSFPGFVPTQERKMPSTQCFPHISHTVTLGTYVASVYGSSHIFPHHHQQLFHFSPGIASSVPQIGSQAKTTDFTSHYSQLISLLNPTASLVSVPTNGRYPACLDFPPSSHLS